MHRHCSPKNCRGTLIVLAGLLLSAVLAAPSHAQSDVYTKWSATYSALNVNGSQDDIPVATVADGQGNVYVTGAVQVCVQNSASGCQTSGSVSATVKYNAQGQTLWRAFLTASPATDPNWGGAKGTGLSIALDAAGNVYVLSALFVPSVLTGPPTIATAKYSPDGARQWVEYIASPYTESSGLQPSPVAIDSYYPTAMAVSPAGDVYIAFYHLHASSPDSPTPNVVKYNTNGSQQWLKTISPTPYDNNNPQAIQLDANENAYLLVFSYNSSNSQMNASEIFKIDPNGNTVAAFGANQLGNPMTTAFAGSAGASTIPLRVPFHVDAQGNTYVAGGGAPTSAGAGEINGVEPRIVAKFDTSGSLEWLYTFGAPNNRENDANVGITDLAVDTSGNVFVAQTLNENGGNPEFNGTDIVVNKFDPTGNLLWTAQYNGQANGSNFDEASAIAVDATGSSYVTGVDLPSVSGASAIATIKYDSAGNQVWVERYQAVSGVQNGPPTALVVSGSDVFVTGIVTNNQAGQAWVTINYGQDALQASPAVLNFGAQAENVTSAAQTVTLTNISNAPWVIKTMNYSGDIHFTNNCPDTLNPGQSCELSVTFTPKALGALTGTITIRDTSPGNAVSPETIQITGTGVS